MYYTSVGVLQQQQLPEEELQRLIQSVSKDIVHTTKVIDYLITQLPSIDKTFDQQVCDMSAPCQIN
jgi:hypothetical protein